MLSFPTPGHQSLLVLISGPSGAGKSTLLRRFLRDHDDFAMSISVTTRPPRPGERDGVDYHFSSAEDFTRRLDQGEFVESAQVFGQHHYATPRTFIDQRFAEGRSVIKDIDVQGATQIRGSFPDAILVFVVPSSQSEIERRLRSRNTEGEESVQRRLHEAERELAQWPNYDYLVINDDLERAANDLGAIVRVARLRIAGR